MARLTVSSSLRPDQVTGDKSIKDITEDVLHPVEKKSGLGWKALFAISFLALAMGVAMVTYQTIKGIGVWGLNKTVGWAFDITNFVFWVGIGHAGTLISAILFLMRQKWRTAV
ncbi:MAG: hydrogenase, partial [bacterium]|nr:hydrogenase [bacterium]